MFFFPTSDLMPPRAARSFESLVRRRLFGELAVDATQHFLHVAHDRHIRRTVLADFRRINIDVDDFRMGRESGQPASYAIIEADAKSNQKVGMAYGHIGCVAAMHARHANEAGMV